MTATAPVNTADARKQGSLTGPALETTLAELDRLRNALSKARQIRSRFGDGKNPQDAPHNKYDLGVRDAALSFLLAAGEVA
jgi:hypothetical protein